MAESIFSDYWYRAADLHPQLASTTVVFRQVLRGELWYVLSSKTSNRQYRVNQLGYDVVGRLDGGHSVQEIWNSLVRMRGNDAPTQHEVLNILSELTAAGMLLTEHSVDMGGLFENHKRRKEKAGVRLNPMSFKVTLFDPTRLLDRLMPLEHVLLTPTVGFGVMILAILALLLTGMHWPELQDYGTKHLASPKNLMYMWLAYPFVKIVHELAHALSIRKWGGAVHELGITLFLMTPVPYVDGSAASTFDNKAHRLMVSAMGVVVELALGSIALFVWLTVGDGWVRELCFACVTVCSVSSLLVNANPLMRFDGYYFLTDWLEVPGLAQQADRYLLYLGERWLLGNRLLKSPNTSGASPCLLLIYGLLSMVYRVFLVSGIVVWLGAKQFALGLGLAVWVALRYIILPFYRLAILVLKGTRLAPVRSRALLFFGGFCILLFGGVLVYPAPNITRAPGMVWVPDEAVLRNSVEGFVEQVFVGSGSNVQAGTEILRLSNPELVSSRQQIQAKLAGQLQAYQGSLLGDRANTIALSEDIGKLNRQIEELDRRIAELRLYAPQTGTLSLPAANDLVGRYFNRGTGIAEIISPEKVTIRMVLSQREIDLLHDPKVKFHVRIAEAPTETFTATLASQQPSATLQLPSRLFGDRLGGPFITDPGDKDGLRTLESVFIVDVEVHAHPLSHIGTKAWVHIENAPQPLAVQWWRSLQQVFLQHFSVKNAAAILQES